MSDVELERWTAEWQSLGGREAFAEELAARVAKDGRRIRHVIVRESLAGVFGVALSGWMVFQSRGEPITVAGSLGVTIFMAVWLTRLVTLREGSYRAVRAGLDSFVELTRRRLDDDLKWLAFSRRTLGVAATLLVPWSVWALVHRAAMYRAEPWRAIVGFGTLALASIPIALWYRRQRRTLEAERARFESLVADRTLDA